MKTAVFYVSIYSYFVMWLHLIYTFGVPLKDKESHRVWNGYVENRDREFIYLSEEEPLPGNKSSNDLFINFTQLQGNVLSNEYATLVSTQRCRYTIFSIIFTKTPHNG